MRGNVLVEKLVGSRWVTLTAVTADDRPDKIVGSTYKFVVPLPALDTGVHRITRDSTAGTLSGSSCPRSKPEGTVALRDRWGS